MITNETTGTNSSGGRPRRRRRRRRYQRESRSMIRSNRITEIWIVAIVSVVLLGAGVSWVVSLSHPGSPPAETDANASGDDSGQNPSQPAVIIIQDNSNKPDAASK